MHMPNILQKKMVRIISGVCPLTHTKLLFSKHSTMTIYQLYSYYVGVLMYKMYHRQIPSLFYMFEHRVDRLMYSFCIPQVPTLRTKKNIKISGPKIWNTIVKKVAINCKISPYKVQLKKCFLSRNVFFK